MKNLWFRAGVTLQLNDDEVDTILKTGADDNGNLANKETLNNGYKLLRKLITKCIESTDGICKGVFYWEPECKPGQYRLGAFTEDGRPTVIMDGFKE